METAAVMNCLGCPLSSYSAGLQRCICVHPTPRDAGVFLACDMNPQNESPTACPLRQAPLTLRLAAFAEEVTG